MKLAVGSNWILIATPKMREAIQKRDPNFPKTMVRVRLKSKVRSLGGKFYLFEVFYPEQQIHTLEINIAGVKQLLKQIRLVRM